METEIGEKITDIRDVTPGIKLYAVFKSTKNGNENQSQTSSTIDANSTQSMEATPVTIYSEVDLDDKDSAKSEITHHTGVKSLFGVSPLRAIKIKKKKKVDYKPKTESQNESNNSKSINDQIDNEDKDIQNDNVENEEENMLSQDSSYSSGDEDQNKNNLDDHEQFEEEEEFLQEENEEEDVLEENENEQIEEKLIKSCIPISNDEKDDIANAYSNLIPESKMMLDKIFQLEDEQKISFYKGMMKILDEQGFNPKMDSLSASDLLIKKAKKYISDHRISNPISPSYMFHSVIVGPPKCGKSTYLGIMAQQFLVDLIVTNSWKKTFVFVADLDKIMSGYQDNQSFYHSFIHHIFQLLMAQLPSMIQYLPKIEKAFHSITEISTKIETFPLPMRLMQNLELRKLSADLQSIGTSLASIWFDPSSLSQWITNLVMLPSILAKAFGFHDVVFILDHFEACTVQMDPLYPFEDSRPIMYVNEYWKYAINNYPFILSTGDETALIESLSPSDETGIDLLLDLELISFFDIVQEFEYSDIELTIDFEDEKMVPLKLAGTSCAGIPIYVDQWIRINKMINVVEQKKEGTDEYEEVFCQMISETETLLFLLILREHGDPNDSIEDQRFGVYNVHRRKIAK